MTDLDHRVPEGPGPKRGARLGRRLLGLGALLLLLGGLAIGVWRHYALHLEVAATADKLRVALAGVQAAVPKIVRLQQGAAKRFPRAIEVAVAGLVDWSNAYATAGAKPLLCIRNNVDALREAAGWIDLAVRGTEAIAPAIKTDPIPQGKAEEE